MNLEFRKCRWVWLSVACICTYRLEIVDAFGLLVLETEMADYDKIHNYKILAQMHVCTELQIGSGLMQELQT